MNEPNNEQKSRSGAIELLITTLVILGTVTAALRVYSKGGFTYGKSSIPGMPSGLAVVDPLAGLSPAEIASDLANVLEKSFSPEN